MLMGHYAAAYVARSFEPRLSLGAAFFAVQLVDVAWAAFILTGIEQGHLDPSLPSNPLVLEHMPFSHSLLGTAAFAGAGYAGVRALGGPKGAGVAFALAVASHWLLDFIVHRPDMTLFGTPPKLGLGLWNLPVIALIVELAFIAGAALHHYRTVGGSAALQGGLVALLLVFQLFTFFGPVPPTMTQVAAAALPTFFGLPALARWLERKESRKPLTA